MIIVMILVPKIDPTFHWTWCKYVARFMIVIFRPLIVALTVWSNNSEYFLNIAFDQKMILRNWCFSRDCNFWQIREMITIFVCICLFCFFWKILCYIFMREKVDGLTPVNQSVILLVKLKRSKIVKIRK